MRRITVTAVVALGLIGLSGCTPEPAVTTTPAPQESADVPATAADWARETFGDFTAFGVQGDADALVELPADISAAKGGIIRVTYRGSSPLLIESIDAAGDPSMLLLNTATPYNSADPASFDGETNWWGANRPPSALRVTADGDWEIEVFPVHQAPQLPAQGAGVRSYLYDGPGGEVSGSKSDTEVGLGITEIVPSTISAEWGGSLRNIIDGSTAPDFAGTLSPGPSWVIVTHRGEWTMTLP